MKEAFDLVCELEKARSPLTESVIKQIHYLVLWDKKDDRGVYRRVPVRRVPQRKTRYVFKNGLNKLKRPCLWESLNNMNFNSVEFDRIRPN